MLNGIRLSKWLQGTNIADDGTLENHSRLHPLYMVSFDQSLYQGFTFGLAGHSAPKAALHNIDRVYRALVELEFPAPDGGTTIYQPDSPTIYYPEGNDWGTHFPFYFGSFDLLVSLTGQDSRPRAEGGHVGGAAQRGPARADGPVHRRPHVRRQRREHVLRA